LTGQTDRERLLLASEDFEAWTRKFPRHGAVERAFFLSAVRLALLAGEVGRARTLIQSKWSSLRAHPEGPILRDTIGTDRAVRAALDDRIEQARAPEQSIAVVDGATYHLELIALRALRRDPSRSIDWWACARLVAA
jgi:hypothetical protein